MRVRVPSPRPKHSDATKLKISVAVKKAYADGRKLPPMNFGYAFVGPHRSDCKCVNCSSETREKISHAARVRYAGSKGAVLKQKLSDAGRRATAEGRSGLTSETGRRGAKSRIKSERLCASRLEKEGYVVFAPYAVCDRIAIKNGKVFFVEFKPCGQSLRLAQQTVRDANPSQYLVRYYEK